jgi:hypothetical protein
MASAGRATTGRPAERAGHPRRWSARPSVHRPRHVGGPRRSGRPGPLGGAARAPGDGARRLVLAIRPGPSARLAGRRDRCPPAHCRPSRPVGRDGPGGVDLERRAGGAGVQPARRPEPAAARRVATQRCAVGRTVPTRRGPALARRPPALGKGRRLARWGRRRGRRRRPALPVATLRGGSQRRRRLHRRADLPLLATWYVAAIACTSPPRRGWSSRWSRWATAPVNSCRPGSGRLTAAVSGRPSGQVARQIERRLAPDVGRRRPGLSDFLSCQEQKLRQTSPAEELGGGRR